MFSLNIASLDDLPPEAIRRTARALNTIAAFAESELTLLNASAPAVSASLNKEAVGSVLPPKKYDPETVSKAIPSLPTDDIPDFSKLVRPDVSQLAVENPFDKGLLIDEQIDLNRVFGGQNLIPTPPEPPAVPVNVPAPIAPTPPAALVTGIELDKGGMPWDVRIHAASRAKNADGTWRSRRGVSADLVEVVEAELKQALSASAAQVVPVSPAKIEIPPVPGSEVPRPPFVPNVDKIAPPDVGTQLAGAVPIASHNNPMQAILRISQAFAAGTVNKDQLSAALNSVGLQSANQLAVRPDLIGAVLGSLGIAL